MPLDILTIGEALVEIMRADIDQPLNRPGPFVGPYPSGAPFIFAVQAARLGMKSAAIGTVGADAFGDCLLHQLEADGVVTDGIRQLPDQTTGIAFVAYNSDGSRNFVFSLGAGGHITNDMLDPALFDGLRCFHLMGSTLSMSGAALAVGREALQMAVDAGALVSFDPNLRPELLPADQARVSFAPFIDAADIFLPTEAELLQLTNADSEEAAIEGLLRARPERRIVVTRGADGCSVYTKRDRIDVPGYAAEEIDPTGAGDCFDAAFITGVLEDMTSREAAQLANACGALAVGAKGPMAGAKSRAAVERFMLSHR
ncbi:MAG: sugar kinase [Chloroflexota bacterium]|nr:sugar kinase [Chloroflexota bacterium]MDE2911293.1 sugar kinase [Chloroflexota bacterium]